MIVVIPSAVFLEPGLAAETGCRSHALIPLGGRPLFQHIRDSYRAVDPECWLTLAVHSDIVGEISADTDPRTLIIGVRDSRSIGATVVAALERSVAEGVLRADVPLIVHMGDTLIGSPPNGRADRVYAEKRDDIYRWTSLNEEDGRIRILQDRDASALVADEQMVAVGVFAFTSAHSFERHLKNALDGASRGEPFFRAVESYSTENPMSLCKPEFWYDFGHVDSYYESKLLHQNVRHFNYLHYDPAQGIVTKTSHKTELFRHQVRWFRQVPDDLQVFLPRIFRSSDGESPSVTMEMLPFPTLSELFVFERLPLGAWNSVAKAIGRILERFEHYGFATQTAAALAHSMYVTKTRARIEEFLLQDQQHARLHASGHTFTLQDVLNGLDRFVTDHGLLDIQSLTPIHGDMCFSNLLFDNRLRLIKMIDPRGEFGVPGIYGDSDYDLAKIFHSVSGGYDFIVTDKFGTNVDVNSGIHVTSRATKYHEKVADVFRNLLLRDARRARRVAAIESLLFLSMLPLHRDRLDRQMAMLAIGLSKFQAIAELN